MFGHFFNIIHERDKEYYWGEKHGVEQKEQKENRLI